MYIKQGENMTAAGSAGKDAEHRTTKTGKGLVSFSVKIGSEPDAAGNKTAKWLDCVVWEGNGAFGLAKAIRKGDAVQVAGTLKSRSFTDKSGADRQAHEL